MATRQWPALTFAQKVDPIVRLCRAVVQKHGGQPLTDRAAILQRVRAGGMYRDGYVFPGPVPPESEPGYALTILWHVRIACTSPDADIARKHTWDAAYWALDAHYKFAWKKAAAVAAEQAGRVHRQKAQRRRTGANAWQREIDGRRPGRSKGAVIEAIAHREGLQPDSVRKALQRRRK